MLEINKEIKINSVHAELRIDGLNWVKKFKNHQN